METRIGWAVRRASALAGVLGDLRVGNASGFEVNVIKRVGGNFVAIVLPNCGVSLRVDVRVSLVEETGQDVMRRLRDLVKLMEQHFEEVRSLQADIGLCEAATADEFEHAERLAALCIEQAQINAELDLNKDEAGAAMAESGGDDAAPVDDESADAEETAEA